MAERTPARDSTILAAPAIGPERRKGLAAFQKAAGLRFRSFELLNLSFIHRSASNEAAVRANNERLEFLGDAVLGAVAANLLFARLADRPEGELAKAKSVVVAEAGLAERAKAIGLDGLLVLGKGEENSSGRSKPAILADTFEALIGAYYLDGGYAAAFDFVAAQLDPLIENVLAKRHAADYKTLLQELSQRLYKSYPDYRLVRRSGPDHERVFWIEVSVNRTVYGPASGSTKKSAEQAAARLAYVALGPENLA